MENVWEEFDWGMKLAFQGIQNTGKFGDLEFNWGMKLAFQGIQNTGKFGDLEFNWGIFSL